ncbi:MAG: tetratricopeptide repeat protein, partial [Candidatus Hydrogenedens sp.]
LEFWRVNDYWSAVDTCKHVIQLDPGYAQAYSYLGMSYKELQEWDLAIEAFTKAVELKPEQYPWNWINIADIHINRGQYESAISALEKAFQLLPNDSFAHTCMGRAYLGLGNHEKAIEYFQKAIELDPTDLRPATELERLKNNPQQTFPAPQ